MMIKIATNFSDVPAGRYLTDGPFSGERFRDEILRKALREHDQVRVNLNDTEGFGSSFLEEAFGGLIRHRYFEKEELHRRLILESDDESYTIEIWQYIDKAEPAEAENSLH